jgi:hypothetical protein
MTFQNFLSSGVIEVGVGSKNILRTFTESAQLAFQSGENRERRVAEDLLSIPSRRVCKRASGVSAQFADKTVTAGFTTATQTSAAFSDEALPDAPCIGEDNVSASGN